jgi:adenosylhomocysteine nucleosidase
MIYVLCGLSEEANVITDRNNVTVLTGIAARDNLDALVGNDCKAIISWGTAGALRPEVKVGEIVLPMFVATDSGIACDPNEEWCNRILQAFKGGAVACPRRLGSYAGPVEIAATAAQKAALATRHSMVIYTVEMISYAVAELARKRGVPWIVVQGISDAYDQEIPPADLNATNPDGSPNIWDLVEGQYGLAAHPDEIRGTIRAAATFEQAIRGLALAYSVIQPDFKWQ